MILLMLLLSSLFALTFILLYKMKENRTKFFIAFFFLGSILFIKLILLRASPLFNSVFEPENLWKNEFVSNVDLNSKSLVIEYKAFIEYPGNYSLDLLCEFPTPVGVNYRAKFLFNIEIYHNKQLIEKITKDIYRPFWISSKSGLIIDEFKLKGNLLFKKEYLIKVYLIKPDDMFNNNYGNTTLYFSKASDL